MSRLSIQLAVTATATGPCGCSISVTLPFNLSAPMTMTKPEQCPQHDYTEARSIAEEAAMSAAHDMRHLLAARPLVVEPMAVCELGKQV